MICQEENLFVEKPNLGHSPNQFQPMKSSIIYTRIFFFYLLNIIKYSMWARVDFPTNEIVAAPTEEGR